MGGSFTWFAARRLVALALAQYVKALWMPCVLVGLPLAAAVLRITSSTLHEIAGEEFLRTARAKGVSEVRVMRRHALPLAVAPVAALTGANMAMLVTNRARRVGVQHPRHLP